MSVCVCVCVYLESGGEEEKTTCSKMWLYVHSFVIQYYTVSYIDNNKSLRIFLAGCMEGFIYTPSTKTYQTIIKDRHWGHVHQFYVMSF